MGHKTGEFKRIDLFDAGFAVAGASWRDERRVVFVDGCPHDGADQFAAHMLAEWQICSKRLQEMDPC